jgi:hypothetical protein
MSPENIARRKHSIIIEDIFFERLGNLKYFGT